MPILQVEKLRFLEATQLITVKADLKLVKLTPQTVS